MQPVHYHNLTSVISFREIFCEFFIFFHSSPTRKRQGCGWGGGAGHHLPLPYFPHLPTHLGPSFFTPIIPFILAPPWTLLLILSSSSSFLRLPLFICLLRPSLGCECSAHCPQALVSVFVMWPKAEPKVVATGLLYTQMLHDVVVATRLVVVMWPRL